MENQESNTKGPLVKEWSFYYKPTNEEAMGGMGIGMGNAQPPAQAAMTGAQQSSTNVGSGDRWDNVVKKYKRAKPIVNNTMPTSESANVSPYDKIGNMMLKKLQIPEVFDSTNDGGVKINGELKHKIAKIK